MEDGASDASEGLGHEEGDATTKGRQDIAVATRNAGDAVAAALGHESFAVTAGHYAKPEAVASARTHQIKENLDLRKFRGSSAPKKDAA